MEEERSELGLSLIKQLASCEKSSRDKALSLLIDSWLPSQSQVSDDLMKKLWKGLFYCVWHADKLPVQSHLAERLSSLLPALDLPVSLHFLSAFLLTMRRDWAGIDVLRLDKFYLLIRRFLHYFFVLLRNNSWNLELSRRLVGILEERTFFADDLLQGNGVNYHVASIFVEEIRPFLPLRMEVLEVLLLPFVSLMGKLPDKVLLAKVKSNVFEVLLKKGRELLEVRKSGEDVDSGSDAVLLGSIALSMGFSAKFYELGSSPECHQGNRKMLFGLHEEFAKLEKDLASSGIDGSIPDVVEHIEEEVPNLIPIAADEMEVVTSEPAEFAGASAEEDVALKKCGGKKKALGDGNEQSKNGKKKEKKKKKKKKKDMDSSKNEGNGIEVNANGGDFFDETTMDGDLVPLNESAMSNLQQQFEMIAAEAGMNDNDVPSSCDSPKSTMNSTLSKKRKRAKVAKGKAQTSLNCGEEDANVAAAAKSGGKSGKKVKFSMENNLVWKPQNPLPPQSLRLPPSATPRGSALKKGVPPGPIREIPTQPKKVKLRALSVKKARKAVKRLKKLKSIST